MSDLYTPTLIAALEARHDSLRRALPPVIGLAVKVARVHGAHDPRLVTLRDEVDDLSATLTAHLDDEAKLLAAIRRGAAPEDRLTAARDDHEELESLLERIRASATGFAPPDWACTSYRALLRELESLEGAVLDALRLERDALVPRIAAE